MFPLLSPTADMDTCQFPVSTTTVHVFEVMNDSPHWSPFKEHMAAVINPNHPVIETGPIFAQLTAPCFWTLRFTAPIFGQSTAPIFRGRAAHAYQNFGSLPSPGAPPYLPSFVNHVEFWPLIFDPPFSKTPADVEFWDPNDDFKHFSYTLLYKFIKLPLVWRENSPVLDERTLIFANSDWSPFASR